MSDNIKAQFAAARRNQIIDAAIAVISQNGFQHTTIRQIAQQAGIADGTIYNYFKNKDAILLGIIARLTEAEERDLHFAEGTEIDYGEFVAGYVKHRMDDVQQQLTLFKILLPEMISNDALGKEVYDQIYGPSFEVAEKYFGTLMSDGGMADVDPAYATRLFASPLLGLLMLALMGDQHVKENWDSYSDMLSQILSQLFTK